jgi:hypothetical protein
VVCGWGNPEAREKGVLRRGNSGALEQRRRGMDGPGCPLGSRGGGKGWDLSVFEPVEVNEWTGGLLSKPAIPHCCPRPPLDLSKPSPSPIQISHCRPSPI